MIPRLVVLLLFLAGGSAALLHTWGSSPLRQRPALTPSAIVEISQGTTLVLDNGAPKIPIQLDGWEWIGYRLKNPHLDNAAFNVVYFPTANADARTLPKLALPPPLSLRRRPPIPVTVSQNGSRSWIEFERDGESYYGVRISPEGDCTVTKAQLWQIRLTGWLNPTKWLPRFFTSEPLVDRRAIWLEMKTSDRGIPLADRATIDSIWSDVMNFFASHPHSFFQ